MIIDFAETQLYFSSGFGIQYQCGIRSFQIIGKLSATVESFVVTGTFDSFPIIVELEESPVLGDFTYPD